MQGTEFYSDGPPFMCFSGVPHYIDSNQFAGEVLFGEDPSGSTILANTYVACSQILAQPYGK